MVTTMTLTVILMISAIGLDDNFYKIFKNSLPKNAKTPLELLLKGFVVPRAGVEPARV